MSIQTSEHTCPACGRIAPETGPCEQCGADLRALQLLWALPPAVPQPSTAPPEASAPSPVPPSRAGLATLALGVALGLGVGVPTGLQLAGAPQAAAPTAPSPHLADAPPVPPATVAPEVPVASVTVPSAVSPPKPAVRLHLIAPGDTLSALALEAYGDENRYDVLLDANPGVRPRALRVGATLRIPPQPTQTTRSIP